MALRGVNSLFCALAASTLLSGCFLAPGRTVRSIPPGEWTEPLGGGARAPFLAETAPESPAEQWRRGVERGIQSAPTLQGNLLIVPTTGRALTALAARDGHRYWTRRFNGPVVGSALRRADTIFVATASRDGSVYAFNASRGRKLWQTKLRSPINGEPLLAGDRVIVSNLRGELAALDARDGHIIWRIRVPGPAVGAPAMHEGAVLVATARDTLVRVSLATGDVLAAQVLAGTPTASMARSGNELLIPLHPNRLARFALPSLQHVRTDTLSSIILAPPAIDADGSAFVLSSDASVWRVTANGAERIASLGGTARESFTLARNGLLVGRLDGSLFLLRRDGSTVWQQQYRGSLRAPVALADGAAFVTLLNGDMVKLQ